jgi:hypothetical protein
MEAQLACAAWRRCRTGVSAGDDSGGAAGCSGGSGSSTAARLDPRGGGPARQCVTPNAIFAPQNPSNAAMASRWAALARGGVALFLLAPAWGLFDPCSPITPVRKVGWDLTRGSTPAPAAAAQPPAIAHAQGPSDRGFVVGLAFWPGAREEDWGDTVHGLQPCKPEHRAKLVRGRGAPARQAARHSTMGGGARAGGRGGRGRPRARRPHRPLSAVGARRALCDLQRTRRQAQRAAEHIRGAGRARSCGARRRAAAHLGRRVQVGPESNWDSLWVGSKSQLGTQHSQATPPPTATAAHRHRRPPTTASAVRNRAQGRRALRRALHLQRGAQHHRRHRLCGDAVPHVKVWCGGGAAGRGSGRAPAFTSAAGAARRAAGRGAGGQTPAGPSPTR